MTARAVGESVTKTNAPMRLMVLMMFVNCILTVSNTWLFYLRLTGLEERSSPGQASAPDPDLLDDVKLGSLHRQRQIVAGAAFAVRFEGVAVSFHRLLSFVRRGSRIGAYFSFGLM